MNKHNSGKITTHKIIMVIIWDTAAFSYQKPSVTKWMLDRNWDRNGVLQCAASGRALWEGSCCLQLLQYFTVIPRKTHRFFKQLTPKFCKRLLSTTKTWLRPSLIKFNSAQFNAVEFNLLIPFKNWNGWAKSFYNLV